MKLKRMIVWLVVIALFSSALASVAEGDVSVFSQGEALTLLSRDDITISLTGKIVPVGSDNGFTVEVVGEKGDEDKTSQQLGLEAVVENGSDKAVYITYNGSVNGSLFKEAQPLANIYKVAPGTKARAWIVLDRTWFPSGNLDALRDCALTFQVYEKPTNLNDDNVLLFEQDAVGVAFDRLPASAPTDARVFNDGDTVTIVDQDGIQITLSQIENVKNGGHILFGCNLTNHTDAPVTAVCRSTINGWYLGGFGAAPVGTEQIAPSETKPLVFIADRRLSGIRYTSELESFKLDFTIKTVDPATGKGGDTLFEASSGTIYHNRKSNGAEGDAQAESTDNGLALVYGLRFGDSRETAQAKLADAGLSPFAENGGIHVDHTTVYGVPDSTFTCCFNDAGLLNSVRSSKTDNGVKSGEAEPIYQDILQQLTERYGAPNGRGDSEPLASIAMQFNEITASMGTFVNSLHHDEWYLEQEPVSLKIDLFIDELGNKTNGSGGIAYEVDIQAVGPLDAPAPEPSPEGEAAPASEPEPTPEPTPSPEPAPTYETLEKGSKGDAVVKLQEKLIALGYLSGKADGDYGNGTARAVEQFQQAEGLPVTGIADNETQGRLFAAKIPFKSDVKVASVKSGVSYSGSLMLYIQLQNTGRDTIDRVDFNLAFFDAYGNLMKYKGQKYEHCYDTSTIKPGKKSPANWYYDFPGMSGATKFAICIYKYHFKNGTTVDIGNDDQTWVSFG